MQQLLTTTHERRGQCWATTHAHPAITHLATPDLPIRPEGQLTELVDTAAGGFYPGRAAPC